MFSLCPLIQWEAWTNAHDIPRVCTILSAYAMSPALRNGEKLTRSRRHRSGTTGDCPDSLLLLPYGTLPVSRVSNELLVYGNFSGSRLDALILLCTTLYKRSTIIVSYFFVGLSFRLRVSDTYLTRNIPILGSCPILQWAIYGIRRSSDRKRCRMFISLSCHDLRNCQDCYWLIYVLVSFTAMIEHILRGWTLLSLILRFFFFLLHPEVYLGLRWGCWMLH